MFNLIIYSNSYKKKNQIIDPYLNISAKNKYTHPTNTKQSKGLSNE